MWCHRCSGEPSLAQISFGRAEFEFLLREQDTLKSALTVKKLHVFPLGHFKLDLLALGGGGKKQVLVSVSTMRISWLKTLARLSHSLSLPLRALNLSSAKCSINQILS